MKNQETGCLNNLVIKGFLVMI